MLYVNMFAKADRQIVTYLQSVLYYMLTYLQKQIDLRYVIC